MQEEHKTEQTPCQLHGYRLEQVEKIIESIKSDLEIRVRMLEENKTEIRGELVLIKKELTDQKTYLQELGIKFDSAFNKMQDSQDSYLDKLLQSQNIKTHNVIEIKKSKLAFWGFVITASFSLLATIFAILAKLIFHI